MADSSATTIYLMNPSNRAVQASVSLSLKSFVIRGLHIRTGGKTIVGCSLRAGIDDDCSFIIEFPSGISKLDLEFDVPPENRNAIALQGLDVHPGAPARAQ